MRSVIVGCSLLAGLSPLPVLAGESLPVRLGYEAPSSCPETRAFRESVGARLRQGRIAQTGEVGRAFDVVVRRENGQLLARLFVDDPEHGRPARELRASSCHELVDAMALVVALAIESPHEVATVAPESPAPPPPPRSPPPIPPPVPLPAPSAVTMAEPRLRPVAGSRWRHTVGARFVAESALAPEPLLGGQLSLGWEHPGGLEIRGYGGWLSGGAVDAGPGRARFRLLGGGAEACYSLLHPLPGMKLGPCLGAEAGALRGEGLANGAIVEGRTATRFWAAGRALGQLRWRTGRLSLELAGGAVLPWVRHSFVFETPDSVIHETPVLGFTLLAGGSVRFP